MRTCDDCVLWLLNISAPLQSSATGISEMLDVSSRTTMWSKHQGPTIMSNWITI